MLRRATVLALAVLIFCPSPVQADEAALLKDARKAFKRIKLRSAAKLEKQLKSDLPRGIVIESGPFDRLIARLLAPDAETLSLREDVLRRFAQSPSEKLGPIVKSALAVLEKENADLFGRIADIEEGYGEVYNAGYMESGEKDRRTRKLTAVLIPFYRTRIERNATVTALVGDALAAMREGVARAWVMGAMGDRSPAVRSAAALALGRIGGTDAQAALRKAASTDADAGVRTSALLGLAHFKTADVKDAFVEALSDKAWQVRALAVDICARARLVEAAGPLIDALAKEDGRLRQDIDDALHALLGVRYYGDAALWAKWFADNAAQVAARAKALAAEGAYDKPLGAIEDWPPRAAADGDGDAKRPKGSTSAFYGIATMSKRVLLVVDISRSMQDPAASRPPATGAEDVAYARPEGSTKMAVARWQLHRAVEALPDDATINLVVYSESYKQWREEMTPVRGGDKKKAHKFIDGLVANGVTNICDSIDKAFELGGALPRGADSPTGLAADTVFLLSDGNPNRGRITDLQKLLTDVERRNRRARLVFHTIGIGEAAGSSFLETLAKQTGGRYVGFR